MYSKANEPDAAANEIVDVDGADGSLPQNPKRQKDMENVIQNVLSSFVVMLFVFISTYSAKQPCSYLFLSFFLKLLFLRERNGREL